MYAYKLFSAAGWMVCSRQMCKYLALVFVTRGAVKTVLGPCSSRLLAVGAGSKQYYWDAVKNQRIILVQVSERQYVQIKSQPSYADNLQKPFCFLYLASKENQIFNLNRTAQIYESVQTLAPPLPDQ